MIKLKTIVLFLKILACFITHRNFSISNATGLYGYVYDFSVDYKTITNNKIHDIHVYLMKKNNIK